MEDGGKQGKEMGVRPHQKIQEQKYWVLDRVLAPKGLQWEDKEDRWGLFGDFEGQLSQNITQL